MEVVTAPDSWTRPSCSLASVRPWVLQGRGGLKETAKCLWGTLFMGASVAQGAERYGRGWHKGLLERGGLFTRVRRGRGMAAKGFVKLD